MVSRISVFCGNSCLGVFRILPFTALATVLYQADFALATDCDISASLESRVTCMFVRRICRHSDAAGAEFSLRQRPSTQNASTICFAFLFWCVCVSLGLRLGLGRGVCPSTFTQWAARGIHKSYTEDLILKICDDLILKICDDLILEAGTFEMFEPEKVKILIKGVVAENGFDVPVAKNEFGTPV